MGMLAVLIADRITRKAYELFPVYIQGAMPIPVGGDGPRLTFEQMMLFFDHFLKGAK